MTNRPSEKEYQSKSLDKNIWKKVLKQASSQKKNLWWLAIIHITLAGIEVFLPYFNKIFIDYFIAKGTFDFTTVYFIIVGLVFIGIQAVAIFALFYVSMRVDLNFAYELREKAFRKLQTLSFSYFDKTPVGWLITRVTSDITRLGEIISWNIMDLIRCFLMLIGFAVIMLLVNWKLALWVLFTMPPLIYVGIWFQTRILERYRVIRKMNSQITSAFNEGISGAKESKAMGIEKENYVEFSFETGEMRKSSIRALTFSALFLPIILLFSSVAIAGILYTGGMLTLTEEIQFGTLVMFVQYVTMFFEPLKNIARILAELQMAQANAERIFDLVETEPMIQDSKEVIEKYGTILEPKPENYEPMQGDVEFKDVSFHYNPEEPILKNFNLKVQAGSSVALVGETGSGKSTIVNLLCRFYEPISGEIIIDGQNYQKHSLGWLRSNLGYVLQSPHLFSGTIKENILFGKNDASDEEIEKACKHVYAHDFIMKLENGYDTEIGEGGSRLSTGQKQLISFARAIISNPALLVLDEATSSIDAETEQWIQEAIDHVLKGRTSFIIAHRLSTIANASIILVIDQGEIKEAGTHEELMNKKSHYYQLYTNQFNEELERRLLSKGEL